MLKVRLAQIPDSGHFERRGLEFQAPELGLSEAFSGSAIQAEFALDRVGNKVYGQFKAGARAKLQCSRCLKALETALKTDFNVLFEPTSGQPGSADEDSVSDEESVFYRGDELNLGEEIRQELELLLPLAPICRPACRGLCPDCGADWNTGACEHL